VKTDHQFQVETFECNPPNHWLQQGPLLLLKELAKNWQINLNSMTQARRPLQQPTKHGRHTKQCPTVLRMVLSCAIGWHYKIRQHQAGVIRPPWLGKPLVPVTAWCTYFWAPVSYQHLPQPCESLRTRLQVLSQQQPWPPLPCQRGYPPVLPTCYCCTPCGKHLNPSTPCGAKHCLPAGALCCCSCWRWQLLSTLSSPQTPRMLYVLCCNPAPFCHSTG